MEGRDERRSLVLVCRARERLCALDVADVAETMRPLPVEPWAAMPSYVLGVALIRGVPTPVVDVGALFGAGSAAASTRFVTVRIGSRRVALAFEEVVGMRALDDAARAETPPLLREAGADVVSAVAALDTGLLTVLDAARIVPAWIVGAVPGAPADDGERRAGLGRGNDAEEGRP